VGPVVVPGLRGGLKVVCFLGVPVVLAWQVLGGGPQLYHRQEQHGHCAHRPGHQGQLLARPWCPPHVEGLCMLSLLAVLGFMELFVNCYLLLERMVLRVHTLWI